MSYQHERDEFISRASKEGLDLPTITKLLKYASALQRLAVAQCNGDWPYNGDRDRPSRAFQYPGYIDSITNEWVNSRMETDASIKSRQRHDACYTVCPKCEASGVTKSAMRPSDGIWVKRGKDPVRVCPDCRTQELVQALLPIREVTCPLCNGDGIGQRGSAAGACQQCIGTKLIRADITPIFGGDPRGAVLRLSTPGFPYDKSGKNGANGLYVPAREK